jgi:hypothetical protein
MSKQNEDLNDLDEQDEDFDDLDEQDGGGGEVDEQIQRIEKIIGDYEDYDYFAAVQRFYAYLKAHLALPCEVTGIEDFRWEEYFVVGPGSKRDYDRLWETQPSFQDRFELRSIEFGPVSEWMLFYDDDIAAHVRRRSDGKKFILGLAELKATDEKSPNYQLLDDFATFVANYR